MSEANPSTRIHLLIVDDDPSILTLLSATLKREPYVVTACSSPEAALRVLRDGRVDIVLSDFMMPGMNGIDLLKEAARLQPGITRFLLTATVQLAEAVQAIRAGHVDQMLRKPWASAALLSTLREAAHEVEMRRIPSSSVSVAQAAS